MSVLLAESEIKRARIAAKKSGVSLSRFVAGAIVTASQSTDPAAYASKNPGRRSGAYRDTPEAAGR
jgi:hypothetical protein